MPDRNQVQEWLERPMEYLADPEKFVGGWYSANERLFYLDLTIACLGREGAEQIAVASRQKWIYHPATRQEIRVEREKWYAKLGLRAA